MGILQIVHPSLKRERRIALRLRFRLGCGSGGTLWTLTERTQMFQGVNAGIVSVAPNNLVGVTANRRHANRNERHQLVGLQNAEGIGWLFALFAAAGAGTIGAQVLPGVDAAVAITPLNDETV